MRDHLGDVPMLYLRSRDGGQSIRDQIAHYDSVKFGCLNISWLDWKLTVFFAGGGHALNPDTKENLHRILQQDALKVEMAIFQMLKGMNFPSQDHLHN